MSVHRPMAKTFHGPLAAAFIATSIGSLAAPCWAQSESAASPEAAAASPGGAPPSPAEPAGAPRRNTVYFVGGAAAGIPLGVGVDIVGGEGTVVGNVVRGKPYSADSITESTQVLADGNRITHVNRARLYRDAQGRRRREQTLDKAGAASADAPATLITIDDPVAGVSYLLDPSTKTAQQLKPFVLQPKRAAGSGEPADGPRLAVRSFALRSPGPGVDAPAGGPETMPAHMPPFKAPMLAGSLTGPPPDPSQISESTEDLGDEVLQGVLAHGTRRTTTIAAGAIGNEMPISIVSERWYSAELEAVILERNTDPRFGETTYKLVDVVKGDPPEDLFAVPQDYEVRTAGAGLPTLSVGPKGPGKPVVIFRRVERGAVEGGTPAGGPESGGPESGDQESGAPDGP